MWLTFVLACFLTSLAFSLHYQSLPSLQMEQLEHSCCQVIEVAPLYQAFAAS